MYWITGILGFVALIAPFMLGYSSNPVAMWTSLILGAVLVVTSFLEGASEERDTWEYWVAGIAGLAAIAAPFVLGFGTMVEAVWTLAIVGVISVLAAGTRLFPGRTQFR